MEQQIQPPFGNPPVNQPRVQPDHQSEQAEQPPIKQTQFIPVQPAQKKSHTWIWVLGGCLTLVIMIIIAVLVLGWMGARKVKNEIQKYQPDMENIKNNIDKINKEGEEWQKKSEEYRNQIPNPEDLQKDIQYSK